MSELCDFGHEDLKLLSRDGDTPVHIAVHEENILGLKLLMKHFPPNQWLDKDIVDRQKNNILMLLCRFTDRDYGADGVPDEVYLEGEEPSGSHGLLQYLLKVVDEHKLSNLLLQENDVGDNVLCVAARYGLCFEVELLTSLELGTGRAVANKCGRHGASPLELAKETHACLQQCLQLRRADQLNERRKVLLERFPDPCDAPGLEPFITNVRALLRWCECAAIAKSHLEKISTPVPVELSRVRMSRPGTEIVYLQVLSNEAKVLKDKLQRKHKYSNKRSIQCKKKPIERQIRVLMERPQQNLDYVETRLLRDPKHPCLKNSIEPNGRQYGLFAQKDIPVNTVICEYTGALAKEGNDDWKGDNYGEYAYLLHTLDEYVKKQEGVYATAYLLDAAKYFNEGAIVNDVRVQIADDMDDTDEFETPFEENIEFTEVLIDGWPHLFLVTKTDVKKDAELFADYSDQYWKIHEIRMRTKQIKALQKENASLRSDNLKLRSTV